MTTCELIMSDDLNYRDMLIAARFWLLGMAVNDSEYYTVLNVMELARKHHDGERNGGEPEFVHQLQIFHSLRTVHRHLRNPVIVYCLVFAHDMLEDANQKTKRFVAPEEMRQVLGDLAPEVMPKLVKMSKEVLGQKNAAYSLKEIFSDPDTSVAKFADRLNNISTMLGIFKRARLERYVKETKEEFLPGLDVSLSLFPDQEGVYENFRLGLCDRLKLIEQFLNGLVIQE